MSAAKRRLGVAAAVAASALVATQAAAVVTASATTPRDGAAGVNRAGVSASQTPLAVREHAAKLAHPMKSTEKLRLSIGLKLHDQAGLDAYLAQMNQAGSKTYHQYLTAAQFNAKYGPTAADEAAVVKWVQSKGLTVTNRYSNRLLVDLSGTAAQVQSAFGVKMNDYTMKGSTYFSNDRDPVVPDSLKSVVSSVDGLNNINTLQSSGTDTSKPMARYSEGKVFAAHTAGHANGSRAALKVAQAKTKAKLAANPHITGGAYDPTDLYSEQAYDVNALQNVAPCCNPQHLSTGTPAAVNIAIATAGSHAFSTDLPGFRSRYPYLAYTYNEYYIDGTPTSLDYEGTMDFEWSMAMANSYGSYLDTPHIYMYSGVNNSLTTFNDIFNQILTNNTAKIVSSSWGCAEFYCYDDATMNTNNNIFSAMAAQGFTMVNSSNDKGAYATCNAANGRTVSFPASNTYWLAISASNLELTPGPVFSSEGAWQNVGTCAGNGGGSGGGCSAKYAAPSWQSVISGFCGSTAKALPDIGLNGDWANSPQNVYFNGGWSGNGGTSISAPMTSGFFSRLNGYRIQVGNACSGSTACGPIGTGASALYTAANTGVGGKKGIYDITSGCTDNNIGSGFCGITGYDRASGWGTYNFLQLAWAMNYWGGMPDASAPTVSITGPSTSGWVTGGSYTLNVFDNGTSAAGMAGYTASFDSAPDNTLTEPHGGTGSTFYSGPATTGGATNLSIPLQTGCHTLYVRAWDNLGLTTLGSYGTVCYDGDAPSVSGTSFDINNKSTLQASGAASVRVAWSGSDATSGISQYVLYRSTDGGSYTQLSSGSTATQYDDALAPGHTYTYAVAAYDVAGNFSGYQYRSVTVNVYDQEDSSVTYTTQGWTRQAVAGSYLGKVKFSTVLNKRVSFAFTGFDVAFVTTKGAAYGNVSLKLDGGSAYIANTNAASTTTRQIVYKSGAVSAGSHTLEVRNQGSSGHSRIDVDAFVVLS